MTQVNEIFIDGYIFTITELIIREEHYLYITRKSKTSSFTFTFKEITDNFLYNPDTPEWLKQSGGKEYNKYKFLYLKAIEKYNKLKVLL